MLECVVKPQDKPSDARDVRDPGLEVHKYSESTATLECVVNPQDKPLDAGEVRDFAEMDHSGSESRATLECAVKPQDEPPDSPVGQRVSAQEEMRQIQSIGVTGTMQGADPRSESKATLEWVDSSSQEEDGSQHLPEYLRKLYTDACTRLTKSQARKVSAVLLKYAEVFAATDLDIGRFTALVHYVKTGNAFPIKQGMRRTPLGFEGEEKKTIDSMLDAGVIEPSCAEWASPPVLVRKKDGTWRYCIDFRAVNNVTVKHAYPCPWSRNASTA